MRKSLQSRMLFTDNLDFYTSQPSLTQTFSSHSSSDKLDRLNASLKEIDAALEEIKTCNQRVSADPNPYNAAPMLSSHCWGQSSSPV